MKKNVPYNATIHTKANTQNWNIHWQLIGNMLYSVLLYLAIVYNIRSMFQLEEKVTFLAIIPGILVILLVNIFNRGVHTRKKNIVATMFLFIITVIFIIQHTYIINGLFLQLNQLAYVVGTHSDILLHKYAITIDVGEYQQAFSYFWGYLSIFIAFICSIIVRYRKGKWLWIGLLPLFAFQLYTGITPGTFHNMFLIFSSVAVAKYSFIQAEKKGILHGAGQQQVAITSTFILLVLFSATFLIINLIQPASSYSKNSIVISIESTLTDLMEDFRYEKNKPNTFTSGDFQKLTDLELRDIPALEVVMDKPTSLYLRGYIGSLYTSERWTNLEYQDYYDSSDLFYWLHQSRFNALNQLDTVYNLANNGESIEEVTMTVNNLNANSKYVYLPYELKGDQEKLEDVKTYNDSMVHSTSFFGNRLYQYQLTPNLVTTYPSLASYLYDGKDTDGKEEYLRMESHYNAYVYQHYMAIPEAIHELMENHLGPLPVNTVEHMPYELAIDKVKTFLNENISYKVNITPIPEGQDFLLHFLEDTKEGYATHYATAATVMFRYLGIPSRYVEGYLITPKDIQGVRAYEAMTIKGTNSHAWTEIYIDEIGWIPIEVTPPYYQMMEKTDLTNYPKGKSDNSNGYDSMDGTLVDNIDKIQEVVDDESTRYNSTNQTQNEEKEIVKFVWLGISILLVIIMLIYCSFIIKNRMELRKRIKMFADGNYKRSIPALFNYSMMLLHYDGLPKRGGSAYSYVSYLEEKYSKEYAEMFNKAIHINQESLYSNHELSEEDYIVMKQFMDQTLNKVIKSKNIFQKIKMRMWNFIY